MKGKVLKMLKTKYAKLGLSKETLEAMAATIETKLTDESSDDDIEAEVNGVENLLKSFQVEADRRVSEATKSKSPQNPNPNEPQDPKEPGKEAPNEIAKAIQEALAPVLQEFAALKGEKVATDRKQRLEAALEKVDSKVKAKAIKDFGRMKFDKEEDFEAYLNETVEDLGEIVVTGPPAPGGVRRPAKGGGSPNEVTDAEADALADAIMK